MRPAGLAGRRTTALLMQPFAPRTLNMSLPANLAAKAPDRRRQSRIGRASLAISVIVLAAGGAAVAKPQPNAVHKAARPDPDAPPRPSELDHGIEVSPEILQAVSAAQAFEAARQKDQFAAPPSFEGLTGKTVRLVKLETPQYVDGKLQFEERVMERELGGPNYPMITLGHRILDAGRYVATNGYGASTTVLKTKNLTWNVLLSNRKRDEVYRYSAALAPEVARKVATGARFIIEGEIQPDVDGKTVGCSSLFRLPTRSLPIDDHTAACWVSIKIQRIAFEAADGSVLREWTAASPLAGFYDR